MHVAVIFLSLNWLTSALFGLDVCDFFKATHSLFCFFLLLSILHTSMESCQSYWESKTGVQADKNVLLLVVRHVNKVCVCVGVAWLSLCSARLGCFMWARRVRWWACIFPLVSLFTPSVSFYPLLSLLT